MNHVLCTVCNVQQHRRQTRQSLLIFTLPKLLAGVALSINGNTGNAGDTGFAG